MNVWGPILLTFVVAATAAGESVMDQVFGEALLNSLSPELKQKLENIHNKGVAQGKTIQQMEKRLRKELSPEEVSELEAAYKRLLLPMIQSTLEQKFGQNYEDAVGEFPIEFDYSGEDDDWEESDLENNLGDEMKPEEEAKPKTKPQERNVTNESSATTKTVQDQDEGLTITKNKKSAKIIEETKPNEKLSKKSTDNLATEGIKIKEKINKSRSIANDEL